MHRERLAIFFAQIHVEGFGDGACRLGLNAPQKQAAVLAHDRGKGQRIAGRLGDVEAQPIGQRCIDVINPAIGQRREEAGRGMVEIGDDELQTGKCLLLAGAVLADVLQRPQFVAGFATDDGGRYLDAKPDRCIGARARRRRSGGHADFAVGGFARIPRLGQLIDGLGEFGIASIEHIHADETSGTAIGGELDERTVGVDGAALGIDHHQRIADRIGQAIEKFARARGSAEMDKAGACREQRKQTGKGGDCSRQQQPHGSGGVQGVGRKCDGSGEPCGKPKGQRQPAAAHRSCRLRLRGSYLVGHLVPPRISGSIGDLLR